MALDYVPYISTPLGKSLLVDLALTSYAIMVGNLKFPADLILLDMENFDVILGMDWLATYHGTVHCYSKEIVFHIPGLAEFLFQGIKKDSFTCLIPSIQAGKLF